MAQISNGESGLSARNKLNEVIDKIEGNSAIGNDLTITGTLTSDGLTVDGDATFDSLTVSRIGDSSTALITIDTDANAHSMLRFQEASSDVWRIVKEPTDELVIDSGAGEIRARFDTNGDISFYEDTGITPKLVWKAADERLGIGTDLPNYKLHLYAADNQLATFESTDANANIGFKDSATTNIAQVGIKTDDLFFATGGSEAMRITSAGRLGVNTTSPATELDVQGTTTTNGLNLDAISETITDTAVDVFVYDTSKDSDGGAWRKRTQATSWYNETLNTSTRGSRKEFPSVAVIVAEAGTVTIYDGDDPDLPMWMVFDVNPYDLLNPNGASSGYVTSVAALNGLVTISKNVNYGSVPQISFIEDTGYFYHSVVGTYKYNGNIHQRNDAIGAVSINSNTIVNPYTKDVAMTVLPNAPIDAATGLPVPTIAVATDGGVSVIKDDGTVVDITQNHGGTTAVDHLTIDPVTNAIYFTTDYAASGQAYKINAVPIPSADRAENSSVYNGFQDHFFQIQAAGNSTIPHLINAGSLTESNDINVLQSTGEGKFAVGEGLGLDQIIEDRSGLDNSMIAYTASDYATGWMNGAIKLATLSDTDDTDVTGSELVTSWVNGTTYSYDTFTTSGASITSAITDGSNFAGTASNAITVTSGKHYVVSFNLTLNSGSAPQVYFVSSQNGGAGFQSNQAVAVSGNNSITLIPTTTGTVYLQLRHQNGVSGNFSTGDISVRLAEEDRSVNGNGLQVFGSVTKNPVNSGADLVAYSGFSNSNYLMQPYNSDLDFATEFCYNVWAYKPSDTSENSIISRGQNGSTNGFFFLGTNSSGQVYIYVGPGQINTSVTVASGVWNMYTVARSSGNVSFYLNGKQIYSISNTNSLSNTVAKLYVGNSSYGVNIPYSGSVALARASATAPSPEQIKKIYEDEKVLFQENAQATLYGSSDAVTALAYDDTTELLHVGTSAGRSVFQGLRRVDNTTDAVGAAISASNGLVAED